MTAFASDGDICRAQGGDHGSIPQSVKGLELRRDSSVIPLGNKRLVRKSAIVYIAVL
jgi:hypothetical protein